MYKWHVDLSLASIHLKQIQQLKEFVEIKWGFTAFLRKSRYFTFIDFIFTFLFFSWMLRTD